MANLIWLGSGLTDPDISLAAALILYSAMGLEKPAALNGPQFLTADVLKKPLRIDFEHPLHSGTRRVFVDNQLAMDARLSGQQKKKALVFRLHEGSFRDELEVPAGRHEVRVEVRWDDNVKTERTVGVFRPGGTQRLEAPRPDPPESQPRVEIEHMSSFRMIRDTPARVSGCKSRTSDGGTGPA